MGDWEEDVFDEGDLMRTKLLAKYGGLPFHDIDAGPTVCMKVPFINFLK